MAIHLSLVLILLPLYAVQQVRLQLGNGTKGYLEYAIKSLSYKDDIVDATVEIRYVRPQGRLIVKNGHLINLLRATHFRDLQGRQIVIMDNNTYQYGLSVETVFAASATKTLNLKVECEGGPKIRSAGQIQGTLQNSGKVQYKLNKDVIGQSKPVGLELVKIVGSGEVEFKIHK